MGRGRNNTDPTKRKVQLRPDAVASEVKLTVWLQWEDGLPGQWTAQLTEASVEKPSRVAVPPPAKGTARTRYEALHALLNTVAKPVHGALLQADKTEAES